MTPRSPPFGHSNPSACTKSSSIDNRLVHSAQTYDSSWQDSWHQYLQTLAYTNTATVIYPLRYNHSGYTCFFLNTGHTQLIIILWTINGTSRHAMKIQTLSKVYGPHQRSHLHADYFRSLVMHY